MFDLSFEKIAVIGFLALLLVGPDRLPRYAAQLAKWVRVARGMADDAKSRMAAEMGPEFEDVDWQKLDPRRYHPRRLLQDAWNGTGDEAMPDRTPERVAEPDGVPGDGPAAATATTPASAAAGRTDLDPDHAGPSEPGILELFAEHEADQRRRRDEPGMDRTDGVAA